MKEIKSKGSHKLKNFGGIFNVEIIRDGETIFEEEFHNGITNEGKDFLLDVMFHEETAATTWYLSLIDSVGYSALAATDTYDNIDQAGNGWDEFSDYGAGSRIEWDEDAASGQSITNSAVATFNITASGTVKGGFLVGLGAAADTVGDHAGDGILWATGLFSSDQAVNNGDQIKITYTVNA